MTKYRKRYQTPSLVVRCRPSDSARFCYTMKGEPPCPQGIRPPKECPLYSLWPFLTYLLKFFYLPASVSVSLSSVYSIVSNVVWMMARNQLVLTHGLSLLVKCHCFCLTDVHSVNIRCIRFEYETAPLWFQKFNIISAGIITVYNRKAWHNLSCLLQAYCYFGINTKLSANWKDLWHNQKLAMVEGIILESVACSL